VPTSRPARRRPAGCGRLRVFRAGSRQRGAADLGRFEPYAHCDFVSLVSARAVGGIRLDVVFQPLPRLRLAGRHQLSVSGPGERCAVLVCAILLGGADVGHAAAIRQTYAEPSTSAWQRVVSSLAISATRLCHGCHCRSMPLVGVICRARSHQRVCPQVRSIPHIRGLRRACCAATPAQVAACVRHLPCQTRIFSTSDRRTRLLRPSRRTGIVNSRPGVLSPLIASVRMPSHRPSQRGCGRRVRNPVARIAVRYPA